MAQDTILYIYIAVESSSSTHRLSSELQSNAPDSLIYFQTNWNQEYYIVIILHNEPRKQAHTELFIQNMFN